MQPFDFKSAPSEAEAFAAHGNGPASRFIAGGTTLLDLMKLHVEKPDTLVDIRPLPLRTIHEHGSYIEIGALVNNNEMAHHALVKKHFPFVSEALLAGASVQLRNLATTSGNLLQRTRCSYFRDTAAPCNKRTPGSGCSAIGGENRMQAILGTSSSCIAAHPSDMAVALMAVDPTVIIHSDQSSSREREVQLGQFYALPGTTPHIETVLHAGELITAIRLPKLDWLKKSSYIKVRDRSSYAFALTSAAVALDLDGGRVRNSRIALGGVGTIPWRSKEAEAVLQGQPLTKDKIREAAKAALTGAQTHGENAFKVQLSQRTLIRALHQVGGIEWT